MGIELKEDESKSMPSSTTEGAELSLNDYPPIEDTERWGALFPLVKSKETIELEGKLLQLSKQLESLRKEDSQEWKSIQEKTNYLEELESGSALERSLQEVDEFFDFALNKIQEEVHLVEASLSIKKCITSSKFAIAPIRISIFQAAREYRDGKDDVFIKLKAALKDHRTTLHKTKLDEIKSKVKTLTESYQSKLDKATLEFKETQHLLELQTLKDKEERDARIQSAMREVELRREEALKKAFEEKEAEELRKKKEREEEIMQHLKGSGQGKLKPIELSEAPLFGEEQHYQVKQENDDHYDRILKMFNENNKIGRREVREARKAKRLENKRRRAAGEKNVPEDDPWNEYLDGVFSDEDENERYVDIESDGDDNCKDDNRYQDPQKEVDASTNDREPSMDDGPRVEPTPTAAPVSSTPVSQIQSAVNRPAFSWNEDYRLVDTFDSQIANYPPPKASNSGQIDHIGVKVKEENIQTEIPTAPATGSQVHDAVREKQARSRSPEVPTSNNVTSSETESTAAISSYEGPGDPKKSQSNSPQGKATLPVIPTSTEINPFGIAKSKTSNPEARRLSASSESTRPYSSHNRDTQPEPYTHNSKPHMDSRARYSGAYQQSQPPNRYAKDQLRFNTYHSSNRGAHSAYKPNPGGPKRYPPTYPPAYPPAYSQYDSRSQPSTHLPSSSGSSTASASIGSKRTYPATQNSQTVPSDPRIKRRQ